MENEASSPNHISRELYEQYIFLMGWNVLRYKTKHNLSVHDLKDNFRCTARSRGEGRGYKHRESFYYKKKLIITIQLEYCDSRWEWKILASSIV